MSYSGSNSVVAQRNAAIAGAGLVVLPTFVGEENDALFRVLPDEIRLMRPIWMSVSRDSTVIENHQPVGKRPLRGLSPRTRTFFLATRRRWKR